MSRSAVICEDSPEVYNSRLWWEWFVGNV